MANIPDAPGKVLDHDWLGACRFAVQGLREVLVEHPTSRERVIDYSYRGFHLMTQYSKALIAAFYDAGPHHSYYTGCSTGGKQGLMEAQRAAAN